MCMSEHNIMYMSSCRSVLMLMRMFTGEFGIVYRATLSGWKEEEDRRDVAVKTLRGGVSTNAMHVQSLSVILNLVLASSIEAHHLIFSIIISTAYPTFSDFENVMQESLKMRDFDHPNVLSLIGISINPPYIVLPYMANGSLLHYLRKERPNLTIANEADNKLVSYNEHHQFVK